MKKKALENIVEKGEIALNEQFHLFSTMFSKQFVSKNPFIATFKLSSAASLNLGWSQNGVLGYEFIKIHSNCLVKDCLSDKICSFRII